MEKFPQETGENERNLTEEGAGMDARENPPNPEREPTPMARVFIVRHGASEYKEYFDKNPNDVTHDLTEEGQREIERASEELSALVDHEKPLRIISSPRIRTKNSAEIIRRGLENDGVDIKPAEVKQTATFQGVKTFVDAAELWTELTDTYEGAGKNLDTEWRTGGTRDDPRLESDLQIRERLKGAFTKGVRILRRSRGTARDLSQTVLVTHGETVQAILAAFHLRPFLDPERKVKTGSIATVSVFGDRVEIESGGHTYELDL